MNHVFVLLRKGGGLGRSEFKTIVRTCIFNIYFSYCMFWS